MNTIIMLSYLYREYVARDWFSGDNLTEISSTQMHV